MCICCTSVVFVYYLLWEKCDLESREICGKQHDRDKCWGVGDLSIVLYALGPKDL